MATYNITITPQDNPAVQTTVSVEVEGSGRAVRVTEMTVRAAQGSELPGTRLPVVDVELLLRAILPPGESAPAESGGRGRRARTTTTTTAPRSPRGGRATAERREAKRGSGRQAAAKAGAKATKASAKSGSNMRAYRRMPDDLAATYEQMGSITALAAHYGVPRHTAQGWMNRLRKQGLAS